MHRQVILSCSTRLAEVIRHSTLKHKNIPRIANQRHYICATHYTPHLSVWKKINIQYNNNRNMFLFIVLRHSGSIINNTHPTILCDAIAERSLIAGNWIEHLHVHGSSKTAGQAETWSQNRAVYGKLPLWCSGIWTFFAVDTSNIHSRWVWTFYVKECVQFLCVIRPIIRHFWNYNGCYHYYLQFFWQQVCYSSQQHID